MLLRELVYSWRNLWKSPGFAITAVLTLALGIGASTAVFTVVDSVILKPLGYRNSGQLVVLWEKVKFLSGESAPFLGPNARHLAYWKEHTHSFDGLCQMIVGQRGVSFGLDHPHVTGRILAQPNFLRLLNVSPMIGRDFNAGDGIVGHDHVVIITYSLWQNLFHGDPRVVGKDLRIATERYSIVGVLPKEFTFPKANILKPFPSGQNVASAPPVEIIMPLAFDPNSLGWDGEYGNWNAFGRLKPGISPSQAEAELNGLERQVLKQFAGQNTAPDAIVAHVQPFQDAMVGSSSRGLWTLMAAVAGLMLIACVNLANAQLGRALTRQREAAVRTALGASKWQLLSSSLAEAFLLSVLGGVAGVLLAVNALILFQRYTPIDLPRLTEVHLNWIVLLFAVVVTLSATFLFGIVPALQMLRADPQASLQQNSARTQGNLRSRRLRLSLIAVQVGGCAALLLITGLFVKSLSAILHTERGFDTSNALTAEVSLRTPNYTKDPARLQFEEGVLARLRSLPGVQSAAVFSTMPLEGETWVDPIRRTDKSVDHPKLWNMRWVSSDYFTLVRSRLVAGRFLDAHDDKTCNAVISEASAGAGWPGEDPIGRQFKWWDHVCTVVGVAANSRINSLKEAPVNMVYLPYRLLPPTNVFFMIRSSQNPESLIPRVRQVIWTQDPELTISRVKTLDAQVNDSLASERFQTFMLIAFGVSALLLAMLGIYGVLSYIVAGRTQEFGVRMAIGATPQDIYSQTLLEGAKPVAIGLLAGWLLSAYAGSLIEKLLYGVHATDWSVALAVAIVFVACATAAALVPAHRAANVDPMAALRAE